jgi:hypothetical protein
MIFMGRARDFDLSRGASARMLNFSNSAHAFQASQFFFSCALASSEVATRSERAIGGLTVNDQNQRR